MLSSLTQLSTVDDKGIFALFTFLMSRQKKIMSLSTKDLSNAFERIPSSFTLQYLRADSTIWTASLSSPASLIPFYESIIDFILIVTVSHNSMSVFAFSVILCFMFIG